MAPPRTKKAKTSPSRRPAFGGVDLERVCDEAWNHFQSYLDNEEDSDELVELIELVRPHVNAVVGAEDRPATTTTGPADSNGKSHRPDATDNNILSHVRSRADLLPALLSVASTLQAEIHISDYLTLHEEQCAATTTSSSTRDNNGDANTNSNNHDKNKERLLELRIDIHKCLQDAMMSSANPACWSLVANFWRMLNNEDSGSSSSSLERIVNWYRHAADHAHRVRTSAIHLLEDGDGLELDNDIKAWIECLLLNQMVGVELEDENDDDNDSDDDNSNDSDPSHGGDPDGNNKPDAWSISMVESTSRFMAAMMLSTLQDHEGALEQLRHLDVTHRIHPNVWKGSVAATDPTSRGVDVDSKIREYTTSRDANSNGFLPSDLHERLCKVFAPDAPYWGETDYSNRGYYSYFVDLNASRPNLIHQMVVEHLLPAAIAQRSKEEHDKEPIVGYEWWVHTRPVHSSLGHNLHFDTDEATLNKSGQIHHPVCSSVVYLTGDPATAGATIVFEQTPDATSNATRCWRNVPVPNSALFFPGNLLHGVLPCPGERRTSDGASKDASSSPLPNVSELDWLVKADTSKANKVPHRLTLLVGFWTRRIPDVVETRLYGPCGPLPSPDEFEWVKQLCHGYPSNGATTPSTHMSASLECPRHESVPCISPAWETVQHDPADEDATTTRDTRLLPVPTGMIDHRYFVKDAPRCFYDALFDKDDDEDSCGNASDTGDVQSTSSSG